MISFPCNWAPIMDGGPDAAVLNKLANFLDKETEAGKIVYPPVHLRFSALECVNPQDVRVVILGQDPYHGPGQANGLSFSVPVGVRVPPSLMNIYKEISRDLGYNIPSHGDLRAWAVQGVLLLNTVLSVAAGAAGSHQKQGWEVVTDAIISQLSARYQHIVFMLWGSHAEKKLALIDADRHRVLVSVHPSPLSAYRGFIGNNHFSEANRYLASHGRGSINWEIMDRQVATGDA